MDTGIVELVTQLIGNLGFPIVCVCAMFWLMNKDREEHREESIMFREALENNTTALNKLIDKLNG